MKKFPSLLFTVAALATCCGHQLKVLAAGDDLDKPLRKGGESMQGDAPHVHDYDEIVSPDMETAWSLAERARVSLKNGNVTRALSLCKRAMNMDDDDMEIHLIYAEALEAKVQRQAEKDPELFKKCIHEWVLVYRNEVGMEKGMTFKGLNPVGTMFNDDDHGILAKKHLIKLTGYAPKIWETDNHYYTKVFKPAETTVTAKIKSTSDDEGEAPARRTKNTAAEAEAQEAPVRKTKSTPADAEAAEAEAATATHKTRSTAVSGAVKSKPAAADKDSE